MMADIGDIAIDNRQWRNDGEGAVSRDGGPHWQGGPQQFQVLND